MKKLPRYIIKLSSLVAQMVKNLPAMWEIWVRFLGWEDPLEKEMATHSSTLAWKIPWTEEPGRLHIVHGVSKSWIRLSDFTFYCSEPTLWRCFQRFIKTYIKACSLEHLKNSIKKNLELTGALIHSTLVLNNVSPYSGTVCSYKRVLRRMRRKNMLYEKIAKIYH